MEQKPFSKPSSKPFFTPSSAPSRRAAGRRESRWLARDVLPLMGLGAAHCLLFYCTGQGIPCVFRLVTGFRCPGCGMTHALFALLGGRWGEAASYNLLSVTLLPVLCLYFLYRFWRYRQGAGGGCKAWEVAFLMACLYFCLAYGVYRNIAL